jgi:hypothetical protein
METLWKTIVDWLWHIAPAFLIRLYWTESRLGSRIFIDVKPRGDVLTFNGGEPSEVTVYLRVWNMLPFTVEVNCIRVTVWCSGEVCQPLQHDEKVPIKPFGVVDIYVRGGQGINLEKKFSSLQEIPEATVTIRADVNCAVRNFKIDNNDRAFLRASMVNVSNELRQKQRK